MARLYAILIVTFTFVSLVVFGQTSNMEILNVDSVLINNKVPFQTTKANLIEKLGNPDSIATFRPECGDYFGADTVTLYFYGQTVFESYEDLVVLRKINFRDSRFQLKANDLTLDNKTIFNDVRKLFPVSAEKSREVVNPIDKKTYQFITIQPKVESDDHWILKFYHGRIIKIEYWIPC
jgi:hypothetical protein